MGQTLSQNRVQFIVDEIFFEQGATEDSSFLELINLKVVEIILDELENDKQKTFVELLSDESKNDLLRTFVENNLPNYKQKIATSLDDYIKEVKLKITHGTT